jgi:hypothetical protein
MHDSNKFQFLATNFINVGLFQIAFNTSFEQHGSSLKEKGTHDVFFQTKKKKRKPLELPFFTLTNEESLFETKTSYLHNYLLTPLFPL